VVDYGEVAGTTFVAYELVDGVDLERLMAAVRASAPAGTRGRLPLPAALQIVLAVAEALDYVHTFRDGAQTTPIIHRDVGPSNILLGWDGSVKLADFGIAKVPGRNSTTGVGEIKGTVRYMAPEQVRGEPLDPRSDLYGLGALLLELASGEQLFEGKKPVQVLQLLATGQRVDPELVDPALPEELRHILRKVLAYEPGERYDTAAKLVQALRGLDALRGELSSPNGTKSTSANGEGAAVPGREALVRALGEVIPPDRRSGSNRTILEESQNMADEKGGSDLDVFEGLAKKSVRPSNLPGSAQPGGPPGVPSAPPAPPRSSAVPPPSLRSGGKTTLLGVPVPVVPPPPGATATPLPPPPPPGGPASVKPSVKTIQSAVPPPPVSARAPLPPPPPGATPSAPPKPPSAPPPMSKPPATLVAAVPPPPKPAASIGSQLGIGSSPPAADAGAPAARDDGEEKTPPTGSTSKASANLDMDWEDEEESTHVFEKRRHAMNRGPRPAAGAPAAPTPPPPAPTATPLPPPPAAAKVPNAALLASSGTAAPRSVAQPTLPQPVPPPPQVPVMPAPEPPVQAAPPAPYVPARREEAPVSRRREGGSKLGIILGVLALLAVVGLAVFMLMPRTGELNIDVKTKSEKKIGKVDIF
ncbi:MAG: serine/threonine protein kinase, partial [Myxococcales bacterium]|nr:serine/threonine protein kinase [Myxococcales bacterium]